MARLAEELRVWYPTCAICIRFLGTSGPSTSVELVVRSLCRQLKILYGTDDDDASEDDADEDASIFSTLVRTFHEQLKSIGKKRWKSLKRRSRPKPLFILLDAIDQLEDTWRYSFQFETWLLRFLPRDVHIIVSFIPSTERNDLKQAFLSLVRDDESTIFTVPRLRSKDSEDIIRSSLQTYQRQLTAEQHAYLLATIERNPKPLYLKLLLDITRTWTCFDSASLQTKFVLPDTIEAAIEQLFVRLETRHGKDFTQYSLAYLVYALDGITENELEDCLSINDVVLNEIYDHHDPPIPNAIHVPSLLCQSFLDSIKDYLTRKRIHDKHVVSFYHRKFSQLAGERYTFLREQCHEHLIEIYSNDQPAYQRTIVLAKRSNRKISDADRLISSQLTTVLNRRKLVALPHHCLAFGVGKDALLRSKCLFNLEFLSCQLKTLGHTVLLDSIRHCFRQRPQWPNLKRLYYAIWSIDDSTIDDCDVALVLAEQILGFIDDQQMSQFYGEQNPAKSHDDDDLEKLLVDCRQYCNTHANSFRSIYAGFPQASGALAWSVASVTHILFLNDFYALVVEDGVQDEDEEHFIIAYVIAAINLQTGKVMRAWLVGLRKMFHS